MKIVIIAVFLFFFKTGIFTQNYLTFVFTPSLTKLDIKDFPCSYLGEWTKYYLSKKNNVPTFGFNRGIIYMRQFKKFRIGIGYYYAEFGQQSGLYYQAFGIYDYPKSYGGSNYVMTYKGSEFPLLIDFCIKNKEKIKYYLNIGVSLNSLNEFRIQNYFLNKETGFYDEGGTTQINYGIQSTNVSVWRITETIPEMLRVAISLGVEMEYNLHKNLSVSAAPTLKYYSNSLKKTNNSTMLDADAFLLGAKMSLNVKF